MFFMLLVLCMYIVKEAKYTCWEISWTLRDTWSDTICLMVHGFWWNSKVRLQWNYAHHLWNKWISSLRINLYNKKNRNTSLVTIDNHVNDIQEVINDIYNNFSYSTIIFEWHSLAWSIVGLINNQSLLKWILFWDAYIPKLEPFNKVLEDVLINNESYVKVKWYKPFIISHKYSSQIVNWWNEYMKNILVPYVAICSENVWFYNHRIVFDSHEKNQKTCMVSWSSHEFQERWTQEKLFELSDNFIESILSK